MLVLLLFAMVAFALVSCSSTDAPTAGGGSDLPNGVMAKVSGRVLAPDSTGAAAIEVYLREILMTSEGDSLVQELSGLTDSKGWYHFEEVPEGRYVLFCQSEDAQLQAVESSVEIVASRDRSLDDVQLGYTSQLVGRLLLPDGYTLGEVTVFVPGLNSGVEVTTNQRQVHYLLNGVPPGLYEIAFSYGEVINLATINIDPGNAAGLVSVRDFAFSMLDITSDTSGFFHRSRAKKDFYISPVSYKPGEEPPWYTGADFSRIGHFSHYPTGLRRWEEDSSGSETSYDVLLAGLVSLDNKGRVVLEYSEDKTAILTGELPSEISSQPVFAVVAGRIKQDVSDPVKYEVVEIELYWDTDIVPGR